MTKKNAKGRFLIVLGAVLIIAALSLTFYNFYHENESLGKMNTALTQLEKEIPSTPQDDSSPFDVFDNSSTAEEEEDDSIELDGNIYMGMITLPTLGQQFPVIKGWNYQDMNVAPCRYDGTRARRDLIICAHNYAGFFDKLDQLSTGDEVIFTDIHGRIFHYTVSYGELINGWDVDSMYKGARQDWDLTLFTCTWSGYSRVTIRCTLNENNDR